MASVVAIAGCAGDSPKQLAEAPLDRAPIGSISERGEASSNAASPAREPKTIFKTKSDDETSPAIERVVELGSGSVIGEPGASAATGVAQTASGDVTLNVVDAEIRDVIQLVLEDALGVNYTVDPAVTGTVTMRTSKPIPAKDVIATLGSILSLNGVAIVDAGGIYKVLPMDRAASAGGRPVGRVSGKLRSARAGVQVAPLYHADAIQLGELLQPFVEGQGSIQVDTARNTLLLTGSPDQVATMSDLIDMFDVDWMKGLSFGLYPLKSVGPTQLAGELDQILGDPEIGAVSGGLRLVPIDRLSALIVIAAEAGSLNRVESWINRLDKKGEGEGEQVYVYEVQNGRAIDLASVLGELFDIQSTSVGAGQFLAPGLEPAALSSSPSLLEDDAEGDEDQPLAGSVGGPGLKSGYGSLSGFADSRSLTQGQQDQATRIVADEANNALLIRATPKEYKKIEAALKELDRQPLQVLLEATIAEVSLQDELSYGVQWFFSSGESSVSLSEFTDGVVGQIFPGFSGLLQRGDVRAVLNALDSVSEVNVISSPQLLVLDNQTAQLEVGDEVPIVTQQAESIDTLDARLVNTVEQRQTGVILNVTPRVNANGLVVLDIQQEVSDVVRTTTSGIDSPTIAQRRIGTSVAVSSDQTVVLGGLIQDDVEYINSGVPFLKDIPVLGNLFGATTKANSRTELLVLITPKVLTNQEDAVAATDELRRRLWSLEPLQAKIQGSLGDEVEIASPAAPAPLPSALPPAAPSTSSAPLTSASLSSAPLPPEPRPTAPRPAGPRPLLPQSSTYIAQLGTAPSQIDAWNVWLAMQRKHQDSLRGLKPTIVPASSTGKVFFTLQVGPFSALEKARSLCSALEESGAPCNVVGSS